MAYQRCVRAFNRIRRSNVQVQFMALVKHVSPPEWSWQNEAARTSGNDRRPGAFARKPSSDSNRCVVLRRRTVCGADENPGHCRRDCRLPNTAKSSKTAVGGFGLRTLNLWRPGHTSALGRTGIEDADLGIEVRLGRPRRSYCWMTSHSRTVTCLSSAIGVAAGESMPA